ncbi:MAG TPA: aldehyde dehydrogenase family protein [Planctomycetes bacterium]|nr:aldehyde dehydrogenase family protein [Planctomycetota bacterium]HIN80290.1 aldehyde dehydrogenase family protein [Planctomycetota bacterium]
MLQEEFLNVLGISRENPGAFAGEWRQPSGNWIDSCSPHDGELIGRVAASSIEDYEVAIEVSRAAFGEWRNWPAPRRGEVVRQIGDALREKREALGALVALETGKIVAEGVGEVQEMIDIADFSVGLSRQLYGLTIQSERPGHRMFEQWQPLGVVGCISAFNFPVAVWSWNALVAAVCGDSVLWKPASPTPLCAVAVQKIVQPVIEANGAPPIFNLVVGHPDPVGEALLADRRIPLVSATGSCRLGRRVAEVVGKRLGRSLLELGGNNAIIVTESADLDLALRGVLFGAVGTAGQRCTSTRRLFLHEGIADEMEKRLVEAYRQVAIGDPLDPSTLMGPLINEGAVDEMLAAVEKIKEQGGEILIGGGRHREGVPAGGHYVEPTLVRARHDMPIVHDETFAPILYLIRYRDLDEVIEWHNEVPQGLSSAIFTTDVRESEQFLSPAGSDCGIANVNIGTSGAEIGGAFGGEKDTGGGRESGSDSWKAYMRRQTCTVNGSGELPLAQGIRFG